MKTHFKKIAALAVTLIMIISLSACGSKSENDADTLVYGSHDYTAINPALYEHGEINSLIFAGLTAHDKDNSSYLHSLRRGSTIQRLIHGHST